MSETPRLFDIHGAVAYFHSIGATSASLTFVRGLINSGQVRHMKIGKKFFVTKSELDAWLARAERKRGARS